MPMAFFDPKTGEFTDSVQARVRSKLMVNFGNPYKEKRADSLVPEKYLYQTPSMQQGGFGSVVGSPRTPPGSPPHDSFDSVEEGEAIFVRKSPSRKSPKREETDEPPPPPSSSKRRRSLSDDTTDSTTSSKDIEGKPRAPPLKPASIPPPPKQPPPPPPPKSTVPPPRPPKKVPPPPPKPAVRPPTKELPPKPPQPAQAAPKPPKLLLSDSEADNLVTESKTRANPPPPSASDLKDMNSNFDDVETSIAPLTEANPTEVPPLAAVLVIQDLPTQLPLPSKPVIEESITSTISPPTEPKPKVMAPPQPPVLDLESPDVRPDVELPPGWMCVWSKSQKRWYFFDTKTNKSVWKWPP